MAPSDTSSMQFVMLALAAILPLSALFSRRLPIGQMAKMALGWAAIFAVGAAIFSFKPQLERGFKGFISGFSGPEAPAGPEQLVRIEKSDDGHFWIDVVINDKGVRMMVDSGATVTSLSQAEAERLGLTAWDALDISYPVETANGTVTARSRMAERVAVGSQAIGELQVSVSPAFDGTAVLGMNFLDRMVSWQVKDDQLLLVFPSGQP